MFQEVYLKLIKVFPELNKDEKTLQLSLKLPFKKHDNLYVIIKNKVKNKNTVNKAQQSSHQQPLLRYLLVERLLK